MTTRGIEVEVVNDVTIVTFTDQKILDEKAPQLIGNQLFALVDVDQRKKIMIDFVGVEYLNSPMVGKLIIFDKKVKTQGTLRMCNVHKDILDVFRRTGLSKLFVVKNTREEALEDLRK